MTSPKVQYAYANGSANHIRPTLLTYPSGRELNYNYGSADSLPDAASRLAALLDDDGSTHLADYSYLGRGMFIETDYAQPEVKYTLVGTAGGDDPDTGDIYRGLDRFGRIKDSYWRDYGSSADVDRIKYGYDRNGNRTYRENPVATANSAYFDEKYVHDLLDRLKHMDRGRLNGQKDAVTDKTFAQCWSLDSTGNWRKFTEDSDGDGVWDLDQLRTANRVNEITDLSEYTGPAWVTPAYNRAGNMTTIPKPADPTSSFTATYDAWNRLVKLEDGSGTVAQYEYDGAKRRTVKKSYSGGVLSETRHFYYTEPSKWQVVEERVDAETDPDRQFVWGQRYIDDLVLRDRDTDADGTLDERLFAMQDANWNVTGIVDSSGDVQERYSYSAYGASTTLTAPFGHRGSSSHQWDALFCGGHVDTSTFVHLIRNRLFSPLTGWFQRDQWKQDMSLYVYCNGMPLGCVDPTGYGWFIPACGAVGLCASKCATEIRQGQQPGPGAALVPALPTYRDSAGKCTIKLKLICRTMPTDWSGLFMHCFIAVEKDGIYVEAVSGMRDDVAGSPTQGMTVYTALADLPDWDLQRIREEGLTFREVTFEPIFGAKIKDECDWIKCARSHAALISGLYQYSQNVDNSNTFISRILRHCGAYAYFPVWAVGSSNLPWPNTIEDSTSMGPFVYY